MQWKNSSKEITSELESWLYDKKIISYAMFDSTFAEEYEYYQKNTYEGKIRDLIKVVFLDHILIGYMVLNYYTYDSIYEVGINPIIINPKYQNQGYGKQVLDSCVHEIEEIVDGRVDQIFATIDKSNLASIHLFESVGFYKKKEEGNFYSYYFDCKKKQ
ncbi:MAG: GNAT family N-acetyltransferase [Anaeroplasmataceae bacterium]|nr:GNAT family N-acetyltransferase [Anaeroplasmataceae bacterium]